ncbi:glycosyltransferase family 4 protein [Campylobacter sp. US33a]|uniref:glycosyltransferase family 4 protein n=1 Tax=Campylobacter sp. US33a TaxID=2498120 RepID=UPI001068732A|nr:glycosyltransferase family 4 protein [Campylobacter sp. US33a]TEY03975.1 glycosyltransferase [Campylobacter sp. US33a]
MKIAFLIGSPNISGGSFVIFEHALFLMRNNHTVVMITTDALSYDMKELNWHNDAKNLSWRTYQQIGNISFDIAIATWWRTFYELHRIQSKKYVYFVQSIESRFYNHTEKPLRKLVDSTYILDIPIITEATWIKKFLYDNYNRHSFLVKNGIRKDLFRHEGEFCQKRNANDLRILVEGPIDVDFKNVMKTIKLCKKSQADEIWLLTSSNVEKVHGVDKVFSRVSIEQTPYIYRSCDVIVKLSYVEGMFGPPLEMFHCGGTAIVYNVSGYDEYIKNGVNGLVVDTDNEDKVIEFINELKNNTTRRDELKKEAIKTAEQWKDWSDSSKEFEEALVVIDKENYSSADLLKINSKFLFDWYVIAENYKNQLKNKKANSHLKRVICWHKKRFPKIYDFIIKKRNNYKYS